jgi:K+-transporting ATPase ATPase B chain
MAALRGRGCDDRTARCAQHDPARLAPSAIISAIVLNAVISPLLMPLAFRGLRYRPVGATTQLRRNLRISGLGGIIAPFVGIKFIDLVVHHLLGA